MNLLLFSSCRNSFRTFLIAICLGVLPTLIAPQPARAAGEELPGEAAKMLEDVGHKVQKGRSQMEGNQAGAIETLRAASQQSLDALTAFLGPGVLSGGTEPVSKTGFLAAAVRQSAEAHYWWGRAADNLGRRDEAIRAFARASRLAALFRPDATDTLPRDTLLAFGGALRSGLPLIAEDDTLTTIAEVAHGRLWEPLRFDFQLPDLAIGANTASSENLKREFLITNGRVYPPVPASTVDASAALSRVPPIHRTISTDALPGVLRLDRMVIGYERETNGPNNGMWRQAVAVFYASPFLTRNSRDDKARAEAICTQFLKVRALMENATGLKNPYARDNVTTLWLSEVSAIWPTDDPDPRVRDGLGILMPRINTPSKRSQNDTREIDVDPLSYPWRAIARKADNAPGDLLFFKLTEPRDETEWLREIWHEYGHASLPAIDGFKPPLEPFANGLLGETLGLLWTAQSSDAGELPKGFLSTPASAKVPPALSAQVGQQAIPALRFWKARGPISPLRRDANAPGLQYLQGMIVYAERVYGTEVLSATLAPLIAKDLKNAEAVNRQKTVTTDSVMSSFPAALRDPFANEKIAPGGVLPIWLPGALDGIAISTEDFVARSPLNLKAGQRVSGWVYVPPRAGVLHIEWKTPAAAPGALQGDATLKSTPSRPTSTRANNAANFDVKTRPGWQRLTFIARTNLTLDTAQFEKTAP